MASIHFSRQTCTGCQLGKHARTKIPKATRHHAYAIMELIHSDVCGPFRLPRGIPSEKLPSTHSAELATSLHSSTTSLKRLGYTSLLAKAKCWKNSNSLSNSWRQPQAGRSKLYEQTTVANILQSSSRLSAPRKGSPESYHRPTLRSAMGWLNDRIAPFSISLGAFSSITGSLDICGGKQSKLLGTF